MELNYVITAKDFVDYNIYFIDHDPLTQKSIRNMSLMLAGLVLVGGTALMYFLNALTLVSVVVYLLLAIACFLGGPNMYKRKVRKHVHMTLRRAVNKHICGPKTLRLTDKGVQLIGESEDTLHPYESFKRVTAAQDQVYLYLDDVAGLIVPNSAFADAQEKDHFIRLLEGRIAEAKQNQSAKEQEGQQDEQETEEEK